MEISAPASEYQVFPLLGALFVLQKFMQSAKKLFTIWFDVFQ